MGGRQSGSPLADAVSERRLFELLQELATFGATERGGVDRQALTPTDTDAKNFVCQWARERGFRAFQDEIGNLFIRRDGTEPTLAPVLVGSHLDTQPTGGKFDGAYGVVAGLEILDALRDAGLPTRRAVEVVAWMNEEGSRFLPGAMGSSVFAGVRSFEDMLRVTGFGGSVRDALAASLAETSAEHRPMDAIRPYAYLEPHIEQGPILEAEGLPIGIVTGVQGVRRMIVEVRGETAHAGTAPLATRRDALVCAVRVISELQVVCHDPDDVLRFTIGRLDVSPGSPNTVPDFVGFTIDLRHPDEQRLAEVTEQIETAVNAAVAPCDATFTKVSAVAPTVFPHEMRDLLRRAAGELGYAHRDIVSGAGHDSIHLAKICPAGMVFVPCHRGLSHHEDESAEPADLAAGARVTAEALQILANR